MNRFGLAWGAAGRIWVPALITAMIATLLYKPLDILVLWLLRRVFFRQEMARVAALENATQSLLHTLDLKELSNLIVNTAAELMGQRVAVLVLFDRLRNQYWIASSFGMPLTAVNKIRVEKEDPLFLNLSKRRGLVEREKLLHEFSWPEVYEISKGFELLGAKAFVPLSCEDAHLGFLALSGKDGGASFSSAEARILNYFGDRAAVSLRNALYIHELRETNEKLKDLHSRLLQTNKLAAIEQLAAGIAHEIHNPLTIISGKAQLILLRKERPDDETLEQALKTIVKQTQRAADITRKLLIFSEPKSSGKDTIDFEAIVDSTVSLISYQTTLDGITVKKTVSRNLPVFTGEINELREVFLNLILNAVQAVDKRGMIHIQIRHLERDNLIEIKIQDTGKGISSEYIPRLFNPFFSTREEGLGLGLFITQQIVHRYRGSIHIESEIGEGTAVLIHLPVTQTAWVGEPVSAGTRENGEN
ncbi:MAG: GHKL domain-containing protein [Candidatus Omnitrophica bacterium]|nr:GHKL domain-containing protein [Candidatus Omnitrophota bacterium]